MNSSVFTKCQQEFPDGDGTDLLQCVSNFLQASNATKEENLKNFLFVISGAMIFFMQAGFATLCAGAVRIKNVQNTMLKNLLDACGAAVAFFLVGEFIYRLSVNDFRGFGGVTGHLDTRNISLSINLSCTHLVETIIYFYNYVQGMRLRLVVKMKSRRPPLSVPQTLPPLGPRQLSGSSNTLSLPLRLPL
jgi:hypothetical protein